MDIKVFLRKDFLSAQIYGRKTFANTKRKLTHIKEKKTEKTFLVARCSMPKTSTKGSASPRVWLLATGGPSEVEIM
jgi:hypothetical protein